MRSEGGGELLIKSWYIQLLAAGLAGAVSSEICPLFGRKIKDEKKRISRIASVSGHAGTGGQCNSTFPIIAPDAVVLFGNGPLVLSVVLLMCFCCFFLYLPVGVALVCKLSVTLLKKDIELSCKGQVLSHAKCCSVLNQCFLCGK